MYMFDIKLSPLSCSLKCCQYTIAAPVLGSCCPIKRRAPATTKHFCLLFPPCLRADPFVSHFVPTLPRFFFLSSALSCALRLEVLSVSSSKAWKAGEEDERRRAREREREREREEGRATGACPSASFVLAG